MQNIYLLIWRLSAASAAVFCVCSATCSIWSWIRLVPRELTGVQPHADGAELLQPRCALKMRNSAFSSHLAQTLPTKCCERSHYTTGVKIFAFITHLFEHWQRPQPAGCCAGQLQPCPACHLFQIIYHLQLADFSCHCSALWTLWESSWCIRGGLRRESSLGDVYVHTVHTHG